MGNYTKGTFGYDVNFLKQHKDVVMLENGHGMVAVVGDYQGRVMTSSSKGMDGQSYGWVNHEAVAQKEHSPQINVYGGEDRFWLGPEGGQFSIYFDQGKAFDFANWRVPACIDTMPMKIIEKDQKSVHFVGEMNVQNYSGFEFKIQVDRVIRLYEKKEIESLLGVELGTLHYVGFEGINKMSNIGEEHWTKEKGALSIWILGMYNPGEDAMIVIPFRGGIESHGLIKDDYFGKIAPERLIKNDKVIYFKADGKSRGKIGILPQAATPYMGSYDPEKNLLTVVYFDFSEDNREYVNAAWEIQENPYAGDVVNAYNDGPVDDSGRQLGPFYELESSSPAKALKRGEAIKHIHRTFHFEGDEKSLAPIVEKLFGLSIENIRQKAATS